jgi:anti-anti-sigma factor
MAVASDEVVRLHPHGELDIATGPCLLADVRRACEASPAVELDLRDVAFVDLTTAVGLWAQLDACRRQGRSLGIVGATESVMQTLRLVGVLRVRAHTPA